MTIEIERKFLVHQHLLPPIGPGQIVVQGYLADSPEVRIRTRGVRAMLTVKGPGVVSRQEVESAIDYNAAREMLLLCRCTITKERHEVLAEDGHTWEIDRFDGVLDGLWLAEIELTHEEARFDRPPWVGAEVTDDARFKNRWLASATAPPRFPCAACAGKRKRKVWLGAEDGVEAIVDCEACTEAGAAHARR